MATAVNLKVAVVMQLNNGTTTTGQIKTVNVQIGGSSQKINNTVYNANLEDSRTKALAISNALAPILDKSIYRTVETTDALLTN